MNTKFEKSTKSSDEWYTPPGIIHSLGEFDLDPCTSIEAYNINHSARNFYTKEDDGLEKEWKGRVWLNPPYSRPIIEKFIEKMAKHNNGIALVYNRCDSKMFQDIIFTHASAMLFLKSRIKFIKSDGSIGNSPGCGSILIAFGHENANILERCGIKGKFIRL